MKKKNIFKISASTAVVSAAVLISVMSASGGNTSTVRIGRENVKSNKDMTKQIGIMSKGGEIVDSFPVGICLRGDANSNGITDIFDAVAVAKYTVGSGEKDFKDSKGYFAGNVNGDKELNIFDAVCIAKFTVSDEDDVKAAWDKVLKN